MFVSSSKLLHFFNKAHLNSGLSLLLEWYCVIVIKQVALFTICTKFLVTMAFTFTFPDAIVNLHVSGMIKSIGESMDLAEKRHG